MKTTRGRLNIRQRILAGLTAFGLSFCAVALGSPVDGMAADIVFVTDGGRGNIAKLYQIDPATGAVINTVGSLGVSITSIAFDPTTGILWGVEGAATSGSPRIFTIDVTTAAITEVGPTGVFGISDLSFRSDGRLYGREARSQGLFLIDKSTGAASFVGSASGTTRGGGMSFDFSDRLFMVSAAPTAHELDPDTGATLSTLNWGRCGQSTRINGLDTSNFGNFYATERNDFVFSYDGSGVCTQLGPTAQLLDRRDGLFLRWSTLVRNSAFELLRRRKTAVPSFWWFGGFIGMECEIDLDRSVGAGNCP